MACLPLPVYIKLKCTEPQPKAEGEEPQFQQLHLAFYFNSSFSVKPHNCSSIVKEKGMWNVLHGLKPAMLMVVAQLSFATTTFLFKLALNDGMSMRVASAYRLTFASAFTVPLALILERKKRPKMTWRVLSMAFLSGLFGGTLFLNLLFEALVLTSATLVSAMVNFIPATTFIMAISFGFEKLNLGAAAGKAKVLGTTIGIGGAMLLIFFKGVEIHIWSSHINLLHPHQHQNGHVASLHRKLLGVSLAIASCCCSSLWLIIQAKMGEEYPSHHSSTALMCTMGAIQSIVFALCIDRDWSQWKLRWNIRLLAVAHAGIVTSGIIVIVMTWCVRIRGPLFASVFSPLVLVFVAVAASLTLDESLHLGSVIGAVLIVCGLYAVLWGKSKEMKMMTQSVSVPLEITKECEAVEVVVMSKPVDDDKFDQNNHSQTSTTRNVGNDLDDLSQNGGEEYDIHNKGKEEEVRMQQR